MTFFSYTREEEKGMRICERYHRIDSPERTHLAILNRIFSKFWRQVEENLGIGLGKMHSDAAQGSSHYLKLPAGRVEKQEV
jgi:hypothetical protein